MDCFHRTNVGASTTVSTNFRVNRVDVTFCYCLNGTFVETGSASGAIVVDNVSHDLVIFMIPASGKLVCDLDFGGKYTIFWNTQKISLFSFN